MNESCFQNNFQAIMNTSSIRFNMKNLVRKKKILFVLEVKKVGRATVNATVLFKLSSVLSNESLKYNG